MFPRIRNLLLMSSALLAVGPAPSMAGPDGATVVGGSATVSGAGTGNVTVNQSSNKAIINWNTFNVGAGETTTFNQPGSSSVVLNRVTGGQGPSEIYGTINANGRVFIINRDGVLVGSTGVINTSGFIASTADIANDDFMAGRYNFSIAGRPDASIVNMGRITANNGGFAALVAPGVRNDGVITATLGTVALASGNTFTLDLYGDNLIRLAPGDGIASKVIDVATGKPLTSLVENRGKLSANGGRVQLTAVAARQVVDSVINNKGIIEANSVGTRNGKIVLGAATGSSKPKGAPKQTIKVSGTISASGKTKGTKGGTIVVSGEDIQVTGAKIDASGDAGGGKVMLGGDWGGGNPTSGIVNNQSAQKETYTIANATTLSVDATTVIDASATGKGNGGKVILWSDNETTFAGTIFAKGGAQSGNGGFVEVSGKQVLSFSGMVNTLAPNGQAGVLLLDPSDFTIDESATGTNGMTPADLVALLAGGDVTIATSSTGSDAGDIWVTSDVTWNGNTSLTLKAHHDILFDDAVITNVGGGNLTLRADSEGTGSGTVDFYGTAGVNFSDSTGTVSIFYNPTVYTLEYSPKYTNPTDYSPYVTTSSPERLRAYMLVSDANDLDLVRTNLNGTYALGRDIDASGIENFQPIGGNGTEEYFTGIFNGDNHTISNLTIAPTGGTTWNIGLFGVAATGSEIRNVTLSNVNVTANPDLESGYQYVGTLVGQNAGTVSGIAVIGTSSVNAENTPRVIAGGLVGMVSGSISGSTSNATVIGGYGEFGIEDSSDMRSYAGGLAGRNDGGQITASSATGNVSGSDLSDIGGLVGENLHGGTILNSFATGNVKTTGVVSAVGGLVGSQAEGSTITNSQATGSVGAESTGEGGSWGVSIGGLVGENYGTITSTTQPQQAEACSLGASFSCASGNVTTTASATAGGLVGYNGGTISKTFATGTVTGEKFTTLGGFVGYNDGTITLSYAKGAVSGGEETWAGGFVGENEGSINQTYAIGTVTGGLNSTIGGFAGTSGIWASESGGSISQSYASGTVTGGDGATVGGFIGVNAGTIDQSYAVGHVAGGAGSTIGGLVGSDTYSIPNEGPPTIVTGTTTNSYWDVQSSGVTVSAGGTGLTTAVLAGGLPAGFDPAIWSHGSYPFLLNLGPQNTGPLGPIPTEELPSQQLVVNDLTKDGSLNLIQIPEIVDTTPLTQQQQQGGGQQGSSQQGGGGSGQQGAAGGGIPGQLDVGPGRFFFIPPPGETRYVTDEVILQIDASITLEQLQQVASQLGLTIVTSQELPLIGKTAYQIRITDGRSVEEVIRALAAFDIVNGATPNYLYTLAQDTVGQGDAGQYVLDKLQLNEIHRTIRGTNVAVAVIDSEIDGTHPDLAGGIATQYNATGLTEKPHAHGTGMAGAIASHRRLSGIAPGARLIAIQAFSTNAAAAQSTTLFILKGLDYAAANNVRIVNMSFAGPRDPSIERAIKMASDRGVILVAAAGNAGPRSPPLYPAADPNVIAVTATDLDDKLFSGANRGKHIAIAAPGVDILVPAPDGAYQLTTGTSVATAHISGVIALLLERNAKLTPADVRRILTVTAKRLGPPEQFGAGLVDPVKALQQAAPRAVSLPAPAAPARAMAAPAPAPKRAAQLTAAPSR